MIYTNFGSSTFFKKDCRQDVFCPILRYADARVLVSLPSMEIHNYYTYTHVWIALPSMEIHTDTCTDCTVQNGNTHVHMY